MANNIYSGVDGDADNAANWSLGLPARSGATSMALIASATITKGTILCSSMTLGTNAIVNISAASRVGVSAGTAGIVTFSDPSARLTIGTTIVNLRGITTGAQISMDLDGNRLILTAAKSYACDSITMGDIVGGEWLSGAGSLTVNGNVVLGATAATKDMVNGVVSLTINGNLTMGTVTSGGLSFFKTCTFVGITGNVVCGGVGGVLSGAFCYDSIIIIGGSLILGVADLILTDVNPYSSLTVGDYIELEIAAGINITSSAAGNKRIYCPKIYARTTITHFGGEPVTTYSMDGHPKVADCSNGTLVNKFLSFPILPDPGKLVSFPPVDSHVGPHPVTASAIGVYPYS